MAPDPVLPTIAAERLDSGAATVAYIVTTDIDAGEGIVSALSRSGFDGRVELKDGFELIEEIS